MRSEDSVSVKLPRELVGRIILQMGNRFASVDASVAFLLERALKEEDMNSALHVEFSNEEKTALEDRLRRLGNY